VSQNLIPLHYQIQNVSGFIGFSQKIHKIEIYKKATLHIVIALFSRYTPLSNKYASSTY